MAVGMVSLPLNIAEPSAEIVNSVRDGGGRED